MALCRDWLQDRTPLEALGVGVTLRIFEDGYRDPADAEPEAADGYIGKFLTTGKAILTLAVEPREGHMVFPFYVESRDGEKIITLARDKTERCAGEITAGEQIYRTKIQLKLSEDPTPVSHTEYPNNNIRVLVVGGDGCYRSFVVALVSQCGELFLLVQKVYQGQFFRDDCETVICPDFPDGHMTRLIAPHLVLGNLAPIAEYQAPVEVIADGLRRGQGRVLWYSAEQQFGAALAVPPGGGSSVKARVHWSQVRQLSPNWLAYLYPGQLVQFEQIIRPVNTKHRKTGFQHELVGVEPV